jgi:hypothetical protein
VLGRECNTQTLWLILSHYYDKHLKTLVITGRDSGQTPPQRDMQEKVSVAKRIATSAENLAVDFAS